MNDPRIVTYSGAWLNVFDPDPDQILIEDIAHSLANQCRFTGHVKQFYSVAQHSLHVSEIVSNENKLTALLHDASEAYLCDLARPIKTQAELGDAYRRIEDGLMEVIAKKFDIEWPIPEEVHVADMTLCRTEQRDLMTDGSTPGEGFYPKVIDPWPSGHAEPIFLCQFELLQAIKELTNG